VILLENLRFHIEEEGKGINKEGQKVNYFLQAFVVSNLITVL
jgi:3-phosphoglycerate kinase